MSLEGLVIGVALLALTALGAVFVLAVVAWRQHEQIAHLGAVCATLARAWQSAGGASIRVDPALLGATPDERAPPDLPDTSTLPETWQRWGLTS